MTRWRKLAQASLPFAQGRATWLIPADSARAAFLRLAEHQLITSELATRLGLAAGLRNILVHEYAEVDLALLVEAVRDGLSDLRQLGASVGALLALG